MAFVIVAHRGTDNPEVLLNLLARRTGMRVIEVEDGLPLEPNCVFVTPGRMDVTTDGIVLRLSASPKHGGWPVQVTLFLKSLAAVRDSRSVAVILSGMGCDGSPALRSLKAAGGIVLAQSDPIYDSMPQSAIDTGHVDFVLSATEIGKHLASMNNHRSD